MRLVPSRLAQRLAQRLAVVTVLVLTLLSPAVVAAQATPGATPVGTPGATPVAAAPVVGVADLNALKAYMTGNAAVMVGGSDEVLAFAQTYYNLASAVGFDYQALWGQRGAEILPQLLAAREAWTLRSSAHYELNEGLVAGIPSLVYYDLLLDAGVSGADDPENALDNQIALPDGRVLDRPGSYFHYVTEPTLWGTNDAFTGLRIDMDGDGRIALGEALPDANVLLGGAQALDTGARDLSAAIDAWQPTLDDTFTALVVMIPTMQGYFNDWKLSPAVLGNASEQTDFVANSRLIDVLGILGGLDVAYDIVQPLVASTDPAMATQIRAGLDDVITFVQTIHDREIAGTAFTPEQADLLGAQLQVQADDVAGQIAQAATLVGATIQTA